MPYKDPQRAREYQASRPPRYRYRPGGTRTAEWLSLHPGYMKAWQAARRAQRRPEDIVKHAAQMRTATERRAGRLIPSLCEICGSEPVHGHHAFGYTPEMALAVWWLCRTHHMGMHRFIRRP